jgi:hypothetical protein
MHSHYHCNVPVARALKAQALKPREETAMPDATEVSKLRATFTTPISGSQGHELILDGNLALAVRCSLVTLHHPLELAIEYSAGSEGAFLLVSLSSAIVYSWPA